MHAVISLLLQSRKFSWYLLLTSSMLLSRPHNDVILLSALCRVSGNNFVPAGQYTSTPHHARATVTLLHQETPNFLVSKLWPQTAQISVLWITRSGLLCSIVSITDKSTVWMNWNGGSSMSGAVLNSQFLTRLLSIDQWRGRHQACVHAEGGHFEYSLWTDNVDFVHICDIQSELFDCYIFNYESCQQRWPIHSCSFYISYLRYGDRFYGTLVIVNFCLQQWINY